MGLKVNGIMWEGVVMWSEEFGIFIWCSLCCSVGIWVVSFLEGKTWWFDLDSWRWLWMSGFVVDREEGVGGGCSGGGVGRFVGGSADWWQLIVLRIKIEDESKQPQPSKRP